MMRMKKNRIITVQDIPVTITQTEIEDYICITDIAAAKSENSRAETSFEIGLEIELR